MKNKITKTLFTLIILALLSACAANQQQPVTISTTDPQTESISENAIQTGYQANVISNIELIYTIDGNEVFDGNARAAFLAALAEGKQQFSVNEISYHFEPLGQHAYRIFRLTPVAESLLGKVEPIDGGILSNELIAAIDTAVSAETLSFDHQGITYVLSQDRKAVKVSTIDDVAIANQYYLEAYDTAYSEIVTSYDFMLNLELALEQEGRSFTSNEQSYGILPVAGGYTISDSQSNLFAELSNLYVIPKGANTTLPLGFKNTVRDAIENEKNEFTYTDSEGVAKVYQLEKLENSWSVTPKK